MGPDHDSMPGLPQWHFCQKRNSARPTTLQMQVIWLQFCHRIFGINPSTELKRYTCVLFYSLGKARFCFLAKLFDVSAATTYQWIGLTAETLGEPRNRPNVAFPRLKKTNDGSSRRWSSHRENYRLGCRWWWCGNDEEIVPKAWTLEWMPFLHWRLRCFGKSIACRAAHGAEKHSIAIEQDNSNRRHHLGRMTQRRKIVAGRKRWSAHLSTGGVSWLRRKSSRSFKNHRWPWFGKGNFKWVTADL